MIPGLLSHLMQSTVFAGAAWLLAVALRNNRAKVRFWIYFTASMKFLVPFALLISLGALLPKPAARPPVAGQWADKIDQFVEPWAMQGFTQASAVIQTHKFNWEAAAFATWVCGFMAISAGWIVRWRRMRALDDSASTVEIAEFPIAIKCAPGLMEPGVFGIFRQVLLLPEGIVERLSPEELSAFLAHEWCHVRRRDNLTSAMHMAVQAAFWFHPLVWWLGARMIRERERACDEEVLRLGNQPQVYAAGILNVCRHYVETPLTCVSGVTGSNLKRRIEAILAARIGRTLSFPKLAALTLAASGAVALPVALGIVHPRPVRAQAIPKPRFDVASIKPCQPGDGPGRAGRGGGDMGTNRGVNPELPEGVGGYFSNSPGRLNVTCGSLLTMIAFAYLQQDTPLLNNPGGPMREGQLIQGIPKWAMSARYTIHAETENPLANQPVRTGEGRGSRLSAAGKLLYGPMFQALLEDRFHLKLHRETVEAPIYALTIAKGGLKIKPMQESDCLKDAPPGWPAGGKPPCGWVGWEVNGPNRRLLLAGITLQRFADTLGELVMDSNVVDRTGADLTFITRLEYVPDDHTRCMGPSQWCAVDPSSDIPAAGTIFQAIQQQMGLKLETIKGPKERIVIDSVQPPSEN